MNRRDFCTLLALGSGVVKTSDLTAAAEPSARTGGFPKGDYTPFGYLDNPWHTWDLHRSGILRSAAGIGFSLYYPAGPGGYFSYSKNDIYEAQLALEFEIEGRVFRGLDDFDSGQLTSSHHSKNLLTYDFESGGVHITSTFLQVNEDAIGVRVGFKESAGQKRAVRMLACLTYRLGPETWWGRDGLAGGFDSERNALLIRSFAAGTVFSVAGSRAPAAHFLAANCGDFSEWPKAASKISATTSYYPNPLHGAVRYELQIGAGGEQSILLVMARAENTGAALKRVRSSIPAIPAEIERKRAEDDGFWSSAPQLTGDWPDHWKRGWVYDFETLRMVVRRPIGVYKHAWDGMQIQAPRNVLAETSIDAWALSYADAETAKTVFLGQFQDALKPNIPCMREDGVMNMVAADGSECGTSISWCFPFFCAESIFNRTRDVAWLRKLYPHLAALLRWTLANRKDSGGFLVGKCSWETGMDASRRFLIEQPTGGELTEFVRLVELQAAAAHAGALLVKFARLVQEDAAIPEWEKVREQYTARTQELWKDGWFRDFDTRSMQMVTSVPPDPAQSAPAFCGVANAQQLEQMRSTLRKFYEDSRARGQKSAHGWDDGLAWSSIVLPYVESIWAAGDGRLASLVISTIAERIYRSMDRRAVQPASASDDSPSLGWPGVSCEIWGAHGAFGGEGYGWGAVMPAHLIRSLLGIRETEDPAHFFICPNLPDHFLEAGREYSIRGVHHAGRDRLDVTYRVLEGKKLNVTGTWHGKTRTVSAVNQRSRTRTPLDQNDRSWQFEAANHERYLLDLTFERRPL